MSGIRFGWWGAAGVALLLGAHEAAADTIYFNARGEAQREQIARGIQPAQLYQDENGLYVRCRILSATPAAWGGGVPTLQIEAWSRVGRDRFVWSAQPFTVDMSFVRRVDHEVDSHLDLQLMLSSRDEPDAPIGSSAWATRLRRVLDPDGSGGLSRGPALRPETPEERRQVTHRGWVLYTLVEEPEPAVREGSPAELDRLREERHRRMEAELRADGIDVLHPRMLVRPARQAVWSLIEGIARAEKYRFLAERQRTDEVPPVPPGAGRRVGRDFVERATIAAGFLCTLAEADVPPRADPRAPFEPLPMRYRRFGLEARDAILTILEEADPDRLTVGASDAEIEEYARRMDADRAAELAAQLRARKSGHVGPAAMLALDPAELGMAAMRVIQEFETFWYADADAERLARALLRLARRPERGASPKRQVLSLEARETLVRMLRPDLRGNVFRAGEAQVRAAEAGRFRAVFDGFVGDPDPAVREAVQAVLAHAGYVAVSTEKAVQELFSLATGEGVPDDAPRDVRRATRRYAITILTVLGGLADPEVPASEEDRALAELVFSRLQTVRDRVEAGVGTEGQREFLSMLPELPERVDEPSLRSRISRFLRFEHDHVRARFSRTRLMLEEAASGRRTLDEEERRRYFEEANRLRRRLDSMRVPDGD